MDKDKLRRAIDEAVEFSDTLPLTIPSPIRDNATSMLFNLLMREPHSARTCGSCRAMAHTLALSALGWEDRTRVEGDSPKKRMQDLLEQLEIAFDYLDKIDHQEV